MNLTKNNGSASPRGLREGAKLSEIQNRLASEFGIKLTYMEARFLVDDLKLMPKDPEPPKVVEPPAAAKPPPTTAGRRRESRRRRGSPPPRRRKSFRDRGPNHAARRDRQRQGEVQRRPDRRLVSGSDGPARRGAKAAGLQTLRRRRAGFPNRLAAGSRQAGLLNSIYEFLSS